jgi:hypothetical protein
MVLGDDEFTYGTQPRCRRGPTRAARRRAPVAARPGVLQRVLVCGVRRSCSGEPRSRDRARFFRPPRNLSPASAFEHVDGARPGADFQTTGRARRRAGGAGPGDGRTAAPCTAFPNLSVSNTGRGRPSRRRRTRRSVRPCERWRTMSRRRCPCGGFATAGAKGLGQRSSSAWGSAVGRASGSCCSRTASLPAPGLLLFRLVAVLRR